MKSSGNNLATRRQTDRQIDRQTDKQHRQQHRLGGVVILCYMNSNSFSTIQVLQLRNKHFMSTFSGFVTSTFDLLTSK